MSTEENELLSYIDNALSTGFSEQTVFKQSDSGSVRLLRHEKTGKGLVKIISANRNDDVFRRLRGKHTPHLPCIYEVCSAEDYLLVLEEYIPGKNLSELLEEGPLDRKTACRYALELCDALAFLHENGIIHRDVKPSNIIIRPDDTAVLIDLSIARCLYLPPRKETQTLGTVGYAAPEQYGISPSSRATDIYAMGVLLNMMLTGVHPTLDLPHGALRRVVEKAVSVRMAKRYQSAQKLKRDIRLFGR